MAQRQQAADELFAGGDIDMHFRAGGLALQRADRGHHIAHRRPGHGTDAHDATAPKAQPVHLVCRIVQLVQDVARPAGQSFAGIGQEHALGMPLEQWHADHCFGLGQGPRCCGLGDPQRLRRDGDLAMLRDCRNQAQVFEVQLRGDHDEQIPIRVC